jgi:hypothetical protein
MSICGRFARTVFDYVFCSVLSSFRQCLQTKDLWLTSHFIAKEIYADLGLQSRKLLWVS